MSIKEKASKELRTELQKLRAMSGRDRLWYISSYYKFHILGIIILLFLIFAACMTVYRSTFRTELYCFYLNNPHNETVNTTPYTEGFAEYMGFGKKQVLAHESGQITYDDSTSELGYATLMKITALVTSKDLDIIIGDKATIDYYASAGGFHDLSKLLPDELYRRIEERIYETAEEDGSLHPLAISLESTAFAESSGLHQNPPLIGIISNSKRTDTAVKLIEYLFP